MHERATAWGLMRHAIMPTMRIAEAEASLRAHLASVGLRPGDEDVAAALAAMMEWYREERAVDAAPLDEDGDMLLFQWGAHDWGSGPSFEYGLTRQLICAGEDDDEGIVQLAMTYRFPLTDETAELGSGHVWCGRPAAMEEFRREFEAHRATAVVRSMAPREVEIRSEVAG